MNLNRLGYFAAVVDTGSFTHAAERLGITKTVVSQQVAKLEQELHTTLLIRTTRRVEPTEAGRLLHGRSIQILADAEDAFAEVTRSSAEPTGLLRIAAPNDYGASVIAPLAAAFTRCHPACQVDLRLSDARIDPIANHIDLSIRVGWLEDSGLQARRIGSFRQYLVATSELARTLALRTPDSLTTVPFIANRALREPLIWQFTGVDGSQQKIRMRQALAIDTTPAVLAATLAGGGLSILPEFLVFDLIAGGRLIVVLPEWSLASGGIHTVYPAARFRPPKVTAFASMLEMHLLQQASSDVR